MKQIVGSIVERKLYVEALEIQEMRERKSGTQWG